MVLSYGLGEITNASKRDEDLKMRHKKKRKIHERRTHLERLLLSLGIIFFIRVRMCFLRIRWDL